MSFADTIKSARQRQHLSLEELARRTGLSYRTIWNIEQGASVPRGSTVRAIAEALDLDLDALSTEGAA